MKNGVDKSQIMKLTMFRHFIGLLFCYISSAVILGLNFYGAIRSALIAELLTIPSTLFGLIFFTRFIKDFFRKNENYSIVVKIIMLLISLPCFLFLIANCYSIVYYISEI